MQALKTLVGAIGIELMRSANYSVDRDSDKLTPAAAAQMINRDIAGRGQRTQGP